MSLNYWFDKGQTFEEYRSNMKVNQAELTHVYDQLQLTEDDLTFLHNLRAKRWRGIVLTADWCGDGALNAPIVQRMAEESQIELRFLIRDENLELMDQYLTNQTARAIPIFIFINEEGEESSVWGPRAEEVQHLVMALRNELPDKNAPDFEEKQKNMYQEFKKMVTTDPIIWRKVVDSVRTAMIL